MPQVGELDRTTYTVSIEVRLQWCSFPVYPLSGEESSLFLAGRTIGFFVVAQCPFSEGEGTDAKQPRAFWICARTACNSEMATPKPSNKPKGRNTSMRLRRLADLSGEWK